MKIQKEWNEYVVGYVMSLNNKDINVQFEKNKNSNHPQPDFIAVIGANGDETIFNFNDAEIEFIKSIIKNDAEIIAVSEAITKIFYNFEENINLYEMSLNDIFSLAEKVND